VDQRRNFITFILLSLLVLMFFNSMFRPQQPANQPPGPAAPGPPAAEGQAQVEAPDGLPAVADLDASSRYVTLGSLDQETGHRMLVTFNSAGASVERAELASEQYLDQDYRGGYMGELGLTAVNGGLRVQVVGHGTPAAEGGLQAGDVIVAARVGDNELPEMTRGGFEKLLSDGRPGEELTLQVRRAEEGGPQQHMAMLRRRPFAVLRPEIENFQMRGDEPPAGFTDRPSFLLTLAALGGKRLEGADAERLANLLETGNWEISAQDANSVTFRRPLPELNLELAKRYTLMPAPAESRNQENYPGYHLELDIEVRNTSEEAQSVAYQLDGPTGMPTEGWWYAHKISQTWSAAGLRDVVVRFDGLKFVQLSASAIADGDVSPMGEGKSLAFAGVDGQYFSSILIPQKIVKDDAWIETTEAIRVGPKLDPAMSTNFNNVTSRLTRRSVTLAPGQSQTDSFQVFIGPKRPELLSQYQPGGNPANSLADVVYYGWPLFAAVARWMVWILHVFYGLVGNYGIAIVMLTVVVRGAMFPLSWKQTQSMARMQALKPEMDRITEKYKNDMQKRSQELQALYRKHNINPLGGCLPVFLQLPIFIGLYKGLMIDVELRGSPLLGHGIHWCSNLAAPDMLIDWSGIMPDFVNRGVSLFGLGPYFNILPIITVALFLVTQKMAMPPATNDQAALQQKLMKYMTIFFGLMFYKVASGLCLYFIASSLWGIAERKMLKKPTGAPADGAATTPPPGGEKARFNRPTKPSGNGSADPKKKRPKPRRK
jgi:YidC/Oxa1 family membrane protein insertase